MAKNLRSKKRDALAERVAEAREAHARLARRRDAVTIKAAAAFDEFEAASADLALYDLQHRAKP